MNTRDVDVLVVGGGAAGLSAALVLARARRRVLVADSGQPRNAPASHMHGFLSRDGMSPTDLLDAGRAEVRGYGADVLHTVVTSVAPATGVAGVSFVAELGDRCAVRARRVLVTTGMSDELPDIPGLRERWARDVLHCPYCHGYEVRDRPLGVLWNGPGTVAYAQVVRQWSDDVVLFAPAGVLDDEHRTGLLARTIGLVEGAVSGIVVRDDRLVAIQLADGRAVPRDVLFVPPRFVPHSALLAGLGCELDAEGWVRTGPAGATSVPGVRVAGNVANPRAQVITAAGEGSAAAIALNTELVDEDVQLALSNVRP